MGTAGKETATHIMYHNNTGSKGESSIDSMHGLACNYNGFHALAFCRIALPGKLCGRIQVLGGLICPGPSVGSPGGYEVGTLYDVLVLRAFMRYQPSLINDTPRLQTINVSAYQCGWQSVPRSLSKIKTAV
jgi:hypothetical protein